MSARTEWQGMWAIARFNWPFYLAALLVLFGALGGFLLLPSLAWKWISATILAGAVYFLAGSLGVSHWIYDRSDLYRWRWLDRALDGIKPQRIVFCHAGFDETSTELRARWGAGTEWKILDHFDPASMTEPSIRRARKLYPPTLDTVPSDYRTWPVSERWAEVVFGLLAIHEFRSEPERTAWFVEARRCLGAGGRIILAEHVRDLANFVAFGPGFLHFHSPASWQRCWEQAGLRLRDEFRVTPWIRIFVLTTT